MWPAKWQWAGSIRWKWWRAGQERGQLALFMLVHSLARTDASTPIPALHPARPERKGSLLFSHNGSRRAAKAWKTKALAGGYFRKCRVCWEREGKVDKQAFRMPHVGDWKPGKLFQHLLISKLIFNKWIYYEQRAITLTHVKAAAQQRARASHHFKARQFKLLLLGGTGFGGRVQEGEMGVVEMHKIQG